jgi:hypothetical protein
MRNEETRHTCCECDADMTETVRAACMAKSFPPLIVNKVKKAATTVEVQCPKGHWCKYKCDTENYKL